MKSAVVRTGIFLLSGCVVALSSGCVGTHSMAARVQKQELIMRDAFVINEDNSHFYGGRGAGDMTLAGLHAFVDQYADSAVTHLFLCPNAMRASFRSTTRDAIWDVVEGMGPLPEKRRRWPDNARILHEAGLDPYAIWIERCREKGISPWISMRMNDLHSVNEPEDFMHSSFWRKHPEYWRVPNCKPGSWPNRALNYAIEAVREHNMAFVRELLERYDPDGLELDWMRFGYHLTPGKEREEAPILTQFVRDVRALTEEWAEKRGHAIHLAVRVPAHPDAAAGLGMDGVLWGRESLVDLLIPCPFWSTSDFDIPVELWKERLGDAAATVSVMPGLEFNSRPWPGGKPLRNGLGAVYGFAESARGRGADGVYLFNFMDSGTRPVSADDYRTLVAKGAGADTARSAVRRFPVCYRDTVPKGFPNDVALPISSRSGGSFKVHIGAKPASGTATIVLGLAEADGLDRAVLQVALNGKPVESAAPTADMPSCSEIGGDSKRALCFSCPFETLLDGHNHVTIAPQPGSPEQSVVWAELRLAP